MATKIRSKAPALRYLSKWILVGGLELIALALVLQPIAASLFPVNLCSTHFGSLPCTDQDTQNRRAQSLVGEMVSPILWLGIAISSIAFIAWANVRRW